MLFLLSISYGHIQSLMPSMDNPQDIRKIASLIGPYGPVAVIGLQFTQVLVAPLPPITPLVSGLLYGTKAGISYSMVGAALGSLTAILLSRQFGRPLVESFLAEDVIEKFDKFTSGHGILPFVVLFVFPGFPDDALCFIAGLTTLDWKKLFLIASMGRLPGIAMLVVAGNSIAEANVQNLILASSGIVFVSYLSIKYEQQLESLASDIETEGAWILSKLSPDWNWQK